MMRRSAVLLMLFFLAACSDVPAWMGGDPPEIKRVPGERYSVLAGETKLEADEGAKRLPVDLPEAATNAIWLSANQAMDSAPPSLPETLERSDSATIGEGNDFTRGDAPAPIVAAGHVFAMDGVGFVSAHAQDDIDNRVWLSDAATESDEQDLLGGGLAYDAGSLYVATGYGRLVALDAKTGAKRWRTNVGAPVRGAPVAAGGMVVVLTADNQTLAFTAETGAPVWGHRGIRELAGFFSNTAPVVKDDLVIAAYSSGQIVALRLGTGDVIWSDSVGSPAKTSAASAFSGIDANPLVQDGVVYVVSAGGVMMANALINGRPLWGQRIAAHETPWAAGNVLFLLSSDHELAAVFKRDGMVRWAQSLKQMDRTRDVTPTLYGPVLAGGRLLVASAAGDLLQFSATEGTPLATIDIRSGAASAPVIAGGRLYLVTSDATLHTYR
ncbi:MAG: PQQ-binding-like beta-propeller repeat protein [Alphaproteobacteria bacterium]